MKTNSALLVLASTVAFAALTPTPLTAQNRSTVTEKRSSSSSSQSGGSGGGSSGGGGFSGGSSGGFSGGSSGGGGFNSGGGNSFGSGTGGGQNFNRRFETRGRAGSRPIVVSSKPFDAKELAAVEEDLGIMARLLEKAVEREAGAGGPAALGITLTLLDGRGPSAMLLEGYGAVFTLPTRLPLTPPPARPSTGKQPAPPADSPWEQARREMFGGAGAGRAEPGRREFPVGMPPGFNPPPGMDMNHPLAPAEFDPKRVENLKKGLLETLKHAGNIRALKGDDSLTVVVQSAGGSGQFGGGEAMWETRTMTSTSVNGEPPRVETHVSRDGGPGAGRAATLTVRAKKADCEDFAKGKLTLEQFAKKVLVNLQ